MCGRFDLGDQAVAALFVELGLPVPELRSRFNIAPTQTIFAVRRDASRKLEVARLRWGLIPSWAKDASIGYRTLNARGETVASKPAFRSAFKSRRCLVPASGFFEWDSATKPKTPWRIVMRSREAFAMAGLWESWNGPEGVVESCTIVTTEPNDLVRPLHDRMPVILPRESYDAWLDSDPEHASALLRPFDASLMERYQVSTVVNNARNERSECIDPV